MDRSRPEEASRLFDSKFLFKSPSKFFRPITIFLPVNASLHWLNNVSCVMIKVDWLAACIVLVSAVAYNLHSPPMGSQWEARSDT
jgi:hypothetical protein